MIESLHEAGPLLLLAIVLLAGTLFGNLARQARLPGITGQILGGVLIGGAGFDLFSHESIEGLQPMTEVALGLIAVTVGAHLHIGRLSNAVRRLSYVLMAESTITPTVVFAIAYWLGGASFELSLLLGAVSIATAPATIVALVRETRSNQRYIAKDAGTNILRDHTRKL